MKPETQLDSWDSLQETISSKRLKVFKAIESNEGATLFELTKILNWPVNRVSGRVTELAKNELIVDSGTRRTNPESGKTGIVWTICKEYLNE